MALHAQSILSEGDCPDEATKLKKRSFVADKPAPISTIEKSLNKKLSSLTTTMLDTRLVGLSHLLQRHQQQQQQQQREHQHHQSVSTMMHHHHQQQQQLQQQQPSLFPNFAHLAAMKGHLTSPAVVASFAQQQLATAEWIKTQLSGKQQPTTAETTARLNPHFLNNFSEKIPDFRQFSGIRTGNPEMLSPVVNSRELPSSNHLNFRQNEENFNGEQFRESSVTHSEGKIPCNSIFQPTNLRFKFQ